MNFLPKDKMTQTALLLVIGLVLIVLAKSMEKTMNPLQVNLVIGVVVLGTLYLVYHVNSKEEFFDAHDNESDTDSEPEPPAEVPEPLVETPEPPVETPEPPVETPEPPVQVEVEAEDQDEGVRPNVPNRLDEARVPADAVGPLPESVEACLPKELLTSQDLLPNENEASPFNDFENPDMKGKNFLDASLHVGIDTVGQSLRNANRQLRSEPPNPQVQVSPWLQSTIGPDVGRRPLEIGSGSF